MLTVDEKGLRKKTINGVEVTDFREIARIFSENPKYKDKSIYLVPDNYIKDITGGAAPRRQHTDDDKEGRLGAPQDEGRLGAPQDMESIVSEAKYNSGRAGRKLNKSDVSMLRSALEKTMPLEDLDEYITLLSCDKKLTKSGETRPDNKAAIKTVYSKAFSKKLAKTSDEYKECREILFKDKELDHLDAVSGEVERGELVPLPITNFSKEQIDDIRLGKTIFYVKRKHPGDSHTIWKKVTIKGNLAEQIIDGGYNNDEIFLEEVPAGSRGGASPPIFQPYVPTGEEMVEITYIYGPNRSGKTYYAAKYATLWSEMFEEWPIFLFSRRDKDKVLDEIPAVNRVNVDSSLVTNPLTMTDFEHSLVIFDDIDTIADMKIRKAIQKLRDDIMETGRQKMIYVVNTSHLGMNWAPTRTVLNEANSYTLFPRKGNYEHNAKILHSKMGMKPAMIKEIMERPKGLAHQGKWGWITVYKDSPQYVMHENGIKLL